MKQFRGGCWGQRVGALVGVVLLLSTWSIAATADRDRPPTTQSAIASPPPADRFAPGVVLTRRKTGVSRDTLQRAVSGATTLTLLSAGGIEKLQVPVGQETATVASLAASGLVQFAVPDYLRHTAVVPDDPLYSQQWSLPKINAPSAWQASTGSNRVIVAVIDTGYDLTHPDRPVNLIAGPTYTSGSAPYEFPPCLGEGTNGPEDDFGHGTHVGGIIAAAMNNGIGVTGLAPGVGLLVIKAGDCQGNFSDSDILLAMEYAVGAGARVVNMSFGGTMDSPVLDEAVQEGWNGGAVLVAAAGNNIGNVPFYPAATPNVMAVSATDQNDAIASFSNWGWFVAVAAPGTGSLSTYTSGTYATLNGTSMAAAHVAATAGLLLSATCGMTNSQVIAAIELGAVGYGSPIPNPYYGYGRLDAAGALQAAGVLIPPTTGPTPTGLSPRWILPSIANQRC